MASMLFQTNHVSGAWTSITGNWGRFGTSGWEAVGDRYRGTYTFVACRVDTVLRGIVNQKISSICFYQSKSPPTTIPKISSRSHKHAEYLSISDG
jgi:hypothetical protein